jgi:hypothetical protein
MKKLISLCLILSSFVCESQTPATGPYYFVTDNVSGNPQFYNGDPGSGTYAGIFTMENYNVLATVLGDVASTLLRTGQTLVPTHSFTFNGTTVALQPFAYTVSGSSKKFNLPIGTNLKNFLNDPLNGAKFDLTLPFTNRSVALSNQSAHLRIDNTAGGVHTSVDFDLTGNTNQGFDVVAARDGIVLANSVTGGAIVLKHTASNGQEFLTIYQHLEPGSKDHWTVNSAISRGQKIGRVDDRDASGNPKYAHLHFAIAVSGPSKTVNGVTIPKLWYLIDPFGVYDYRRNSSSSTDYNYLPNNTLASKVQGRRNAYSWQTDPPENSFPVSGELEIGESKSFNISANKAYNFTGIYMRTGQTFSFTTASPGWNNGSTETDCNGYAGSILDAARRHPDLNVMALTGELFNENNNTLSYNGHYFRIGCGPRTHTVTKSGFFVAFANDMAIAYGDNSRVVTLTIKRTQ